MALDDATFDAWGKAQVEPAFVGKLLPLKGKTFENRAKFYGAIKAALGTDSLDTWAEHTWRRGLPEGRILARRAVDFHALGLLGQYLVVIPSLRIVGVRMRRFDPALGSDKRYTFDDFTKRLWALAPRQLPGALPSTR
jgi:hypothetical protein